MSLSDSLSTASVKLLYGALVPSTAGLLLHLPLPLRRWCCGLTFVCANDGGVSSKRIGRALNFLLIAYLLRVGWLVLKVLNIGGDQGTNCSGGPNCPAKVYISGLTRLSHLCFLIAVSMLMRPAVIATHAHALGAVTDAGVAGVFDPQLERLPKLGWDFSRISTDAWMLALQFFLLMASTIANLGSDSGQQIYDAYDLQLVATFILLAALFACIVAHFRVLMVESFMNFVTCARGSEMSITAAERRAFLRALHENGDDQDARLLEGEGGAHVGYGAVAGSSRAAASLTPRTKAQVAFHRAEARAAAAYARLAWTSLACCILLSLRAAVWAYTPVTGTVIPGDAGSLLYPAFFYPVPEVIVPFLLINLVLPSGLLRVWTCRRRPKREVPPALVEAVPAAPQIGLAAAIVESDDEEVTVTSLCAKCTHTPTGAPRVMCMCVNGCIKIKCRCKH